MKIKLGFIFAAAIFLSGCGTTWINLDDSKASLDKINAAKSRCNHDSTLAKLQYKKVSKNAAVVATSSVAKKKALEEEYALEEKNTYAKLNACMAKQGLKPIN